MHLRSLCALILSCSLPLTHVSHGGEIDQAEVFRRGNLVEVVGTGYRQRSAQDSMDALSPPANDSDKWFISLLTTRNCAACSELKQKWTKDPWLLALANPSSPKESWAHYNVYVREDQSQSFRFENLQITGYPTVLVQPPRSGKYGDPKTIVFQAVYGGDPQHFAQAIVQSIRDYVSKINSLRTVNPNANAAAPHGVDPPWQPIPKDTPSSYPTQPTGGPVDRLLQIVPPQSLRPEIPWSTILSLLSAGISLPTAAALALWLIYFVRAERQAKGKPPIIEPAKLDNLIELLKKVADSQPPKASKQ